MSTSITDDLITARELGEMLIRCGDLPVKLRTEKGGEICCVTLVRRDAVALVQHFASDTDYGDIPKVARLDIAIRDNA